jgi:hypothetical protein
MKKDEMSKIRGKRNTFKILVGKLKGREQFRDSVTNGKTVFN